MLYACGHDSNGERNPEYEALLPHQRMPMSSGQCPKCVELRNRHIVPESGWDKIKFESYKPTHIIPIDPEILKIARIFLEKYEVLSDKDRIAYSTFINCLMNPPLVFDAEDK